jgi:hypothetical protein
MVAIVAILKTDKQHTVSTHVPTTSRVTGIAVGQIAVIALLHTDADGAVPADIETA